MFVLENTASVVATNLGETPEQQALNGITIPDPAEWEAKRYDLTTNGRPTEVLAGDGQVYRYIVNNNAIPKVGGGFETLTEMAERIAYKRNCTFGTGAVSNAGQGGVATAIDAQLLSAQIVCPAGVVIPTGTGKFSFDLELGAFDDFTWNGAFKLAGKYGQATQVQGGTGIRQVWRVEDFDLGLNSATSSYEIVIFNDSTGTQAGSKSFWFRISNGSVDFTDAIEPTLADIYDYQHPRAGETCILRGENNTASFFVGVHLMLTCDDSVPTIGKGFMNGIITIRNNNEFTWNGITGDGNGTPASFQATRMPNDGADNAPTQRWIVKNAVFDFTKTGEIYIPSITGETGLTGEFEGHVSVGAIPTERGFIGDIDWWVLNRSNARESFFDTKPAVGIGRRGAVQVQVSSDKPFDSVALVNCECLEAEVDYFAGEEFSCQVRGADTTPNLFLTSFFLSLNCIGNAPTTGTGLLDGVITLRSDTNFTWNGAVNTFSPNPTTFTATRMPNDGADDAMVQRWLVKGEVFDFTRLGEIIINNAISETRFTGSFEGVVSYEGNTTITLSPDAPHEASDLLFTDLQPIANDAGIYTATINIRADTGAIPTDMETAEGRPTASIGQIIIGRSYKVGFGLDNPNQPQPEMIDGEAFEAQLKTDANSFTRKQIDGSRVDRQIGELGVSGNDNTNIIRRPAIYQVRAVPNFPRDQMQTANRQLYALRGGTPAIFYINAEAKFGTMVYGILKEVTFFFTKGTDDGAHASMIIESLV